MPSGVDDDVQVFAATEVHVWVQGPAPARARVHVHDPSYHQSPCRNSRSVMPPEAMSVGHAASGLHTELSSLLPPEAMVISWSHAAESPIWFMVLLHQWAVLVVCAMARNSVEGHDPCSH